MKERSVLWVTKRYEWHAATSGYDRITRAIAGPFADRDSISYDPRSLARLMRWLVRVAIVRPKQAVRSDSYRATLDFFIRARLLTKRYRILHVTDVEAQLDLIESLKTRKLSVPIIGTCHMPPSRWQNEIRLADRLSSSFSALIVLSSSQKAYFDQRFQGRTFLIPYGVDTQYFKPDVRVRERGLCLFCGFWMRDYPTLARVIEIIHTKDPSVRFEVLIPLPGVDLAREAGLRGGDRVRVRTGVSDEELRMLYASASLLVMPLIDCTTNNTILEANASGLPSVLSDVGGVRDYADETFADFVPAGDAAAMADRVLRRLAEPESMHVRGAAARSFAQERLDWSKVAARTLEAYDECIRDWENR